MDVKFGIEFKTKPSSEIFAFNKKKRILIELFVGCF